jgi:subtilisin family serine protease
MVKWGVVTASQAFFRREQRRCSRLRRGVIIASVGVIALGASEANAQQIQVLVAGPPVHAAAVASHAAGVGPGLGIAIGIGAAVLIAAVAANSQSAHAQSATKGNLSTGGPGGSTGVPRAGESRFVPDEVLAQLNGNPSQQMLDAFIRRWHLVRLESQNVALMRTTIYRWRIIDGRSVRAVTAQLSADRMIRWVQPNYLYSLEQVSQHPNAATVGAAVSAQYALDKLHLNEAHKFATGDNVPVAVIDSGIDVSHPELAGAISEQFDALGSNEGPNNHGTAVAGIIAAHSQLVGAAPAAHILAVRAFGPIAEKTEGTTFNILKGLDWAQSHGARIVNMSFAGPPDPLLQRALESAWQRGIILIAAAGNAGPKSPPLYPAADPNVIAVTATDADDHLFDRANRGSYITVAAPGVDILVPIAGGGYDTSSGTSFAAAYVSGVAALILQRGPRLSPEAGKRILTTTAKHLSPKGRDDEFGLGLVDAYQAILSLEPKASNVLPSAPAVR